MHSGRLGHRRRSTSCGWSRTASSARSSSARPSRIFSRTDRMPWWAVGLSVMATQLSAITLVGTTGQGYNDGLAVRAVLLRAAARDDHPVRDAGAVFLPREGVHRVRVSRAALRSEDARVHQFSVSAVPRHVVRRHRGGACCRPVGHSRVERHDDGAPHSGAGGHLHDARRRAGGHLDRRQDDGADRRRR